MIDERDVKGLEIESSSDEQDYDAYYFWNRFQQQLFSIFKGLGVNMPMSIISIIRKFLAGITFIYTSDGGEFLISTKALRLSTLLNMEAESNRRMVYVDKISRDVFSLIGVYLNRHNGVVPAEIAKPIRSVKMEKIVEDEWDARFANSVSKRILFQIILGSNNIGCQSLVHLMCAKVATLIKGKSPEEIKRILSQDDDEKNQNNEQWQTWLESRRLEDTGEQGVIYRNQNNEPVQIQAEPLRLESQAESLRLEGTVEEDAITAEQVFNYHEGICWHKSCQLL